MVDLLLQRYEHLRTYQALSGMLMPTVLHEQPSSPQKDYSITIQY